MNRRTIGRYEIERELGRGGMGVVYLAHDPLMPRQVAVKLIAPQSSTDPGFRARFQREVRAIAALEHPAIVPVYDYGVHEGQPYLVLRYMPGGSLSDRLQPGPMALAQATSVLAWLAPAIDEAHQHGIIHRDLKPNNILFDQRDKPYLADFGIAKLIESDETNLTLEGKLIGSPDYMSPEQVLAQEKLDGRSDIYSLGVILYQMLTGRLPYQADTPMGLALAHVSQPLPDIRAANPHLPQGIQAIINRALAKNRAERYPTASQLAEELARAARPEEVVKESRPEVSPHQPQKPVQPAPRTGPESAVASGDHLLVQHGDQSFQVVPLGPKGLTIGRASDNDLVLDLPDVSPHHVRLTFVAGRYQAEDLNSASGTFLYQMALLPGVPETFAPGSVLKVAGVSLRLQRGDRPGPGEAGEDGTLVVENLNQSSQARSRVSVSMAANQLAVAPGGELALTVQILNQGRLVDHFQLSLDGLPADWLAPLPPPVQLMPNQRQSVRLLLRPPRAAHVSAGAHPFTIRVASQTDPAEVAELPAVLMIAAYTHFSLDLRPRWQSGVHEATFTVLVSNSGNEELTVQLEAIGSEAITRCALDRPQLTVAADEEGQAQLTVRSTLPLAGETIQPHPFTVRARVPDSAEPPQQVQGVWEQGRPAFELALRPARARSSGPASFSVVVSSRATSAVPLRLAASDPQAACLFELQPSQLTLQPAQVTTANLTVRARAPLPGETARAHSFTVTATPEYPGSTGGGTGARRVEGQWEQAAPAFALELQPARQSSVAGSAYTLQLTNQSDIPLTIQLEAFDLEGACLMVFEPTQLSLPPDESRPAKLTVRPRGGLPGSAAHSYPFTVSAKAAEAPGVVRPAQAEWQQLPPEFRIAVQPSRTTGRARAHFTVSLTNQSDADLTMALEATDADGACRFLFRPSQVVLPRGQAATVVLAATPRQRLKGKEPRTRAITVAAYAAEAPRLLRQVQAEWQQLPGGRARWASLPLNLLAWLLLVAAWGLAGGVFGLLLLDRGAERLLQQGLWQPLRLDPDLAVRLSHTVFGVAAGALGGALTGIALRLAEPSAGFRKFLAVTVAWALAWGIAGYGSLVDFARAFPAPAVVIPGFLGGLLTGLILRRAELLKVRGWQVALLALAWGVAALAAAAALEGNVSQSLAVAAGLHRLRYFSSTVWEWTISGSFFGAVGGLATLILAALARRDV